MGVFLGGDTVSNHDIVMSNDIGEGPQALLCLTDETECCDTASGGVLGQWVRADGSEVGESGDVYESRGLSVLSMNRRSGELSGLFRCVIPDTGGANNTIYVGIYPSNQGTSHVDTHTHTMIINVSFVSL